MTNTPLSPQAIRAIQLTVGVATALLVGLRFPPPRHRRLPLFSRCAMCTASPRSGSSSSCACAKAAIGSNHPGFGAGLGEMDAAGDASEFVQSSDNRDPPFRRNDEHHEPAATGAGNLAADRALGESALDTVVSIGRC